VGLFDRSGKGILQRGIAGIAVIRESRRIEDDGTDEGGQRGEFLLNDMRDAGLWGKHRYVFTLEVRIPETEPYEVSGEFKTPAKAGRTGVLSHRGLEPGLELPVKVDRGDPQRIAIDWDAFLASPGRKAAVKEAVQDESANANKRMLDANPDLAQQLRANNAVAVMGWANAVNAGKMSREKFDKTVDLEVKVGRMDPADAEAARARLTEP
jgi:hypothetical protein